MLTDEQARMSSAERLKITSELEILLSDFWHEVDTNWGREAAQFFTEDGVFEASKQVYRGRERIEAFYRYRQSRGARVAAHAITNFRAVPTSPTTAISTWYLFLHAHDGEPVLPTAPPIQVAMSTDQCVKCEDGLWRYQHRKFDVWFSGGVPTTTLED